MSDIRYTSTLVLNRMLMEMGIVRVLLISYSTEAVDTLFRMSQIFRRHTYMPMMRYSIFARFSVTSSKTRVSELPALSM